jgi:hypothetical protein
MGTDTRNISKILDDQDSFYIYFVSATIRAKTVPTIFPPIISGNSFLPIN